MIKRVRIAPIMETEILRQYIQYLLRELVKVTSDQGEEWIIWNIMGNSMCQVIGEFHTKEIKRKISDFLH